MSQYICPICEKPMSSKHYCSYCRTFVKNPILYTGPIANAGDVQMKNDCMADVHYGTDDAHREYREYREYRAPKKKKKKNKVSSVLAASMIMTAAVVAATGWGWSYVRSRAIDRRQEIINLLPEADGRFYEYSEDQELTDEEAIALGEPCTGYQHFDMDVYEFCDYIGTAFEEQGLTMNIEDKAHSRNVIYASGYSYFQTDMYISLYNQEGEEEGWMNIEYDTVSLQPEDIWIYTKSIEDMKLKVDILSQAVEELTGDPILQRGEWAEVESGLKGFLSAARNKKSNGSSGFVHLENAELWGTADCYSSGESICLSIEPKEN